MLIQHRNAGTITAVVAACIISVVSCGQSGTNAVNGANLAASSQSAVVQPDHGPAVDRIIIESRTDLAQAIAELVAGDANLILNPLPPAQIRNIGPSELEKLQVHSITAGSWSILINPIPDAAPYTWTTAPGQTSFNPLAIREVRYALHWLFNRQYLVDEVLGGHGVAGFTPLPPGLASTAGYDAVPAGLGMSAAGDENRAAVEITAAMEEAARLPENEGRLPKAANGFWQYDGRRILRLRLVQTGNQFRSVLP
jgi:peptide/nickel transport system substrate-binding protein